MRKNNPSGYLDFFFLWGKLCGFRVAYPDSPLRIQGPVHRRCSVGMHGMKTWDNSLRVSYPGNRKKSCQFLSNWFCACLCSKHFNEQSLQPHCSPLRSVLFGFPLYRWGNWGQRLVGCRARTGVCALHQHPGEDAADKGPLRLFVKLPHFPSAASTRLLTKQRCFISQRSLNTYLPCTW